MTYTKQTWTDGAAGGTPISAARLQYIENGLEAAAAPLDSNGNLTADVLIRNRTSTVTAAGTTTLTIADTQVQVFTGSTTQTVKLPTTGVIAGQSYTIINNSSASLTVQSSGANTILAQTTNAKTVVYTAVLDTPVAAADWQITAMTALATTAATTFAMRDGNGNLLADNFINPGTSTATAAGTTTLDINARQTQVFTGATTQTVLLPTTGVVAGQMYIIVNNSTGSVTVQSSGANTVATVLTNTLQLFIAQVATPTTAAHWRAI